MSDKEINSISSLQLSCQKCSLNSLCIPQGIVDGQLQMFEDIVSQLPPISDKRYLYHQGDEFKNIYVVRSGSVKHIYFSKGGNNKIIGFSLPGEVLGISAIATDSYCETAITIETTTVCEIKYAQFETLCEIIPSLEEQVLKRASQSLNEEQRLVHTTTSKNSQEGLALFFSSLSTRFRLLGYSPYEFQLPMRFDDIGNYLGFGIESVSQASRTLVEKGLIELTNRSIKIKDIDGLKVLAGHCDVCPSLKTFDTGQLNE